MGNPLSVKIEFNFAYRNSVQMPMAKIKTIMDHAFFGHHHDNSVLTSSTE